MKVWFRKVLKYKNHWKKKSQNFKHTYGFLLCTIAEKFKLKAKTLDLLIQKQLILLLLPKFPFYFIIFLNVVKCKLWCFWKKEWEGLDILPKPQKVKHPETKIKKHIM